MLHLAQFSHTPLSDILEWPADDVVYWYNEAVKLSKKIYGSE